MRAMPARPPDLFDRYLRLLGTTPRRPSLEALRELTRAHLTRVPFESVSKLWLRKQPEQRGLPSLESFLDGIERHRLGGTCYANNYHLNQLLTHLGYRVSLCGADMSAPDVHVVNLVSLDASQYLVDGGYAAPFLEPMCLDLTLDHVVPWGRDRYVLKPRDSDGRPRLEHHRDGRLRHSYRVNPAPRQIEEFAGVIADSFRADATFMNALLVVRFSEARSLTLRNLTLTEADAASWRSREVGRHELPLVIEREFGIPRAIASEALDGVELTQNG
jgi:N-hydroxyarylamine O-acetyltransferase